MKINSRPGKILIGFILLMSISVKAQVYKVTKINESGTRAIIEKSVSIDNDVDKNNVKIGDSLTYKDEFSELCVGKIVNATKAGVTLDISECTNKKSVKVGSEFTVSAPSGNSSESFDSDEEKKVTKEMENKGPTKNEDWYTLWGIGKTYSDYGSANIDDAFAQSENSPGVSRTTINIDLLGFYWPMSDKKSMQGFIINGASDVLSDEAGNTVSLLSHMYSYSFHTYFGKNIGDGWFLRGDVGLSRYIVDIDVQGFSGITESSDFGLGILGGFGYAFAIGQETRMQVGLSVSLRKAEDERTMYENISMGFLF
jgi:hypothetical protein